MWALVLPGGVPIFSVILLMNFFISVPKSLDEAARIDGANPWQTLILVYLPISIPCLATITLFSTVGHWNDFFGGLLLMTRMSNYPLLTYIQLLNVDIAALIQSGDVEAIISYMEVSNRNLNAAKIVVATVPLIMIYPFLQRYFITGIVIGSVKE